MAKKDKEETVEQTDAEKAQEEWPMGKARPVEEDATFHVEEYPEVKDVTRADHAS